MRICLLLILLFVRSNVQAQPVPAIASLLARVSSDSLRKTAAEVSGVVPVWLGGQQDTIASRQYNTPGNEKAFAYLRARLQQYGCAVDSQVFSATGKNLFAVIPGADTNRLIVLGAHYDNIGYPKGQGADDNASGIAAVMECLRLCSKNGFEQTVVFAFWDEEETGSVGSAAFLQWPRLTGKALTGYVNLDMIGWDGNGDSIAEVHTRPSGDALAWAARALDLNADYTIGLQLQTVNPGIAATDVRPFWQAGLTAIGFGEDFDGEPYPYRHSPDDTLGNLNLGYLTKQTKLALATVLTYASLQPMAVPTVAADLVQHSPNPFNETLFINHSGLLQLPVVVTVTDAIGHVLYRRADAAPHLQLDTRHWPDGLYLLSIVTAGTMQVYPMVHAGR